jgi:hypothetical protein
MPKEPPAAGWVWKRGIFWMFANKMAVVGAASSTVGQGRGQEGLEQVNLDQIPVRTESAGGFIGYKKRQSGDKVIAAYKEAVVFRKDGVGGSSFKQMGAAAAAGIEACGRGKEDLAEWVIRSSG